MRHSVENVAYCCAEGGEKRAGRKLLCGGGGGLTRKPIFPTPPPSLAAVTGGGVQDGGARPAVPGGRGLNPTSMAQNDTHVALIILTTQMWGGGGGGGLLVEKTFSGQICDSAPLAPTSVLTQNKGPDTEPHFSKPPPLLRRASMSPPPPPPPQSNFQVAKGRRMRGSVLGPGTMCIEKEVTATAFGLTAVG